MKYGKGLAYILAQFLKYLDPECLQGLQIPTTIPWALQERLLKFKEKYSKSIVNKKIAINEAKSLLIIIDRYYGILVERGSNIDEEGV